MFNWIAKRYASDADKLYSSYNTTLFIRHQDREVLWVLDVILGQKTQIEADEAMIKMTYNIIKAHTCYDFPTFLANEIKENMEKVNKANFQHSSYL